MAKMMTADEYNNLLRYHCPLCESVAIKNWPISEDGDVVYRECECQDCGEGWVEYYNCVELERMDR